MNLFKQIETLFRTGTAGGLTDGQLLERFVQRRDEAAFAVLVDRHGAMVLRVCRQILGDEHDAQDASQATFLVLARRAGSITRRDSVACWLHGVALRVAAKARLADVRRRARERRGGEMMAARHVVDADAGALADPERWDRLHDELGRLPESFREPLVLCYLEGLTQEQAAAQLRCPLGTVQSRLARGRAKLKARLTKRGVNLAAAFPEEALSASQHAAAPSAWAEATVRLAMQFTQANGSGAAAAASAAALAEEVLRAMLLTKLKIAVGTMLFAAVLISGAATWAQQQGKTTPLVVATKNAVPTERPDPAPTPENTPASPERVTRTLRGIVRDEQGRPVAKAWVGWRVERSPDTWRIIEPLDRVRERKQPFRDHKGNIVPPGKIGKYFELCDDQGNWQPVHPADIQRHDPKLDVLPLDTLPYFDSTKEAIAQGQNVFDVRTAKGRWEMEPCSSILGPADRTDPQGHFRVDLTMSREYAGRELHFASADFSRQAIHVVRLDDPDQPVEIALRPVRLVRARVIETPKDEPQQGLEWHVYSVDAADEQLYKIPAIGEKGAYWVNGSLEFPDEGRSTDEKRRLEVRLPAGRYKIRFESDSVYRFVNIVVPAGDGSLDLPDIRLETLAWVTMVGKPAAEIEAIDLDGKPVKLADYRGKVVVLTFLSSKNESSSQSVLDLAEIQKRFKDQPLAILALHDASLTSLAKYEKALEPLRNQFAGEIPIRFLLDRPPIGTGIGPFPLQAGEDGSGRTADTYEIVCSPTTFVIGKIGKIVLAMQENGLGAARFAIGKDGELDRDFCYDDATGEDGNVDRKFVMESLEAALEDQFGLPKSRPAKPAPRGWKPPPKPNVPLVVKGKLVHLEGKPIAGATLSSVGKYDQIREKVVKSGPSGDFSFTFDEVSFVFKLKVEGSGLASKVFVFCFGAKAKDPYSSEYFRIEPTGLIPEPLRMGPGAAVTGRVVREGKSVAGVTFGLKYLKDDSEEEIETKTDERGTFRFPHIRPETEFWAYAKVGSLESQSAVIPKRVHTAEDGSTIDLGDLQVQQSHTLSGLAIFPDGKVPARNTVLLLASSPNAGGSIESKLDETGRFEFSGLPDGPVSVDVRYLKDLKPYGYRFSPKNKCLNPELHRLEGQLDRNITDLTILFEPDKEPVFLTSIQSVDPAIIADFNDAKAGPITGVPPADFAKGH
ncbi:MAG: sigma-70 family RNA polymerase sigma factor [Fimbriimonadales bacterium]